MFQVSDYFCTFDASRCTSEKELCLEIKEKNMSASHPDQYLNYKINHITNYNLICSGSVSEQENP
jgi:hypothetical protein